MLLLEYSLLRLMMLLSALPPLALISEDDQADLHAMAENSRNFRLQWYSQWLTDLLAVPLLPTAQSCDARPTRYEPPSPPDFLVCVGASHEGDMNAR